MNQGKQHEVLEYDQKLHSTSQNHKPKYYCPALFPKVTIITSWNALSKNFNVIFGHNVEAAPNRYYLEKIKHKSTENYQEYALRWIK